MAQRRALGLLLAGGLALALTACFGSSDKKDDPAPSTDVPEALHFAFKTPEWNRQIDCEQLSLPFYGLTGGSARAYASSASTGATFYFTYPADSSALVQPAVLRRYAINAYLDNTAPGELSFKVPATETSPLRLISKPGLSAASFNEIMSVKYAGRNGNYARFNVKCRYQMLMKVAQDSTLAARPVSGTYHLRVEARRR